MDYFQFSPVKVDLSNTLAYIDHSYSALMELWVWAVYLFQVSLPVKFPLYLPHQNPHRHFCDVISLSLNFFFIHFLISSLWKVDGEFSM